MVSEITATGWKFLRLRDGGRIMSDRGECRWTIGEWQAIDGQPETCERGFHCSPRALQALSFVHGEIVAQVKTGGKADHDGDKSAWQRMRVVRAWRWTRDDSVRLAIFAAEQVLGVYEARYPEDQRPRKAIEAARAYLADHSAADAAYAAADAADAADGNTREAARREMFERVADWMELRIAEHCRPIEAVGSVEVESC